MDVKTVISKIKQLPPTPEVLPKLRALLKDGNSSVNDIISLIKLDQSLAAQIVRVSNSVFYGGQTPSQNLEDAVNRIGFNEVYKLVAFVATSQVLCGENKLYRLAGNELWIQSITCATVMQRLAQTAGEDSDSAYTIGLLHAIGKVAVNAYFVSNHEPLPSVTFGHEDLALEREHLGFDHTEAGAELLQKWKFLDEVTLPIRQQFAPHTVNGTHRRMVYLLSLSKWSLPRLEMRPQEIAQGLSADPAILKGAGFDEEELICALMAAKATLHDIQDLIKMI